MYMYVCMKGGAGFAGQHFADSQCLEMLHVKNLAAYAILVFSLSPSPFSWYISTLSIRFVCEYEEHLWVCQAPCLDLTSTHTVSSAVPPLTVVVGYHLLIASHNADNHYGIVHQESLICDAVSVQVHAHIPFTVLVIKGMEVAEQLNTNLQKKHAT